MSSVLRARITALPRRVKAQILKRLPPPSVKSDPANAFSWIAAAKAHLADLDAQTRDLIRNHELHAGASVVATFSGEIRSHAGDKLRALASRGVTPATIAEAIGEIVRWKTIAQCADAHRVGAYFEDAERYMQVQWDNTIWPIISQEDFTHTLDLACGHGRNSAYLSRHAKTLHLVDVNESCIAACRARFGDSANDCRFFYHLTDGNGLADIDTGSLTFVYSWDAMVHFDKLVVRDYVHDIARVLAPGGTSFLHHSNFGAIAPNSNWAANHGSRSDMTAALMVDYAAEAGLSVKFQRLSGRADGWGMDDLDCLTLLQKPSAG